MQKHSIAKTVINSNVVNCSYIGFGCIQFTTYGIVMYIHTLYIGLKVHEANRESYIRYKRTCANIDKPIFLKRGHSEHFFQSTTWDML